MTEESAVKVCVRVRPLIAREESAENAEPVQLHWKTDKKSVHQIDDGGSTKSFSFDRVFTADETTSQLYQDIAKPLVVSTVEGYNGTIFAYGQTSSGKTFTMMGNEHLPGVIPLAVEDVFQTIKNCPKKEFLLRVSYMEIYNETVADLLVDSWKRKPLEVRETLNKNIYVADLTEELVTSPAQALAWIRKGEKNRHYGKTKMNQRSSRSHTIFRMILESRERSDPASGENADGAIIVSHLNLVDLAGSERASQTGAEGARFKEGCNINRSLLTLSQVIKKLTDESQKGFTNYRDSKLTRILQNSLGGNAKTVIICTITPVTLDETLSTLQFASTAKKMKNDPHVTEVSDDGALLKRYRNEIVDLKRRLHEVTSVTHTTVTEKKVLSQLLQEKDQLQREQEDRIRNLTKLLVTSSNLVPVPKMPKRRVTWGGKMLRLARLSDEDGSSDHSFAEPFSRKRKGDRSCLVELGEDDEEFDSHWGIAESPSDEMETSQSTVTVRSFGERDFVSPDRMRELSGKVSNLEMQLEMESQQKEEAMAKMETLNSRVAELELQLQTEAQQKQDTLEKMQTTEQKAAELELQVITEAQQKLEVVEKAEMLELRVADLERRLEDQSLVQTEDDKQMKIEFAETIQLCEVLNSEKVVVTAERDYLKQQLEVCIEQSESLEKEKAALLRELKEKKEMDEFTYLEVELRDQQEDELKNEISCLKKAVESSELQCRELQKKLETVSEQLKKKSEFAEELQSMNGKDLMQEVVKLRRSLDDAEGVSRDTKKEWAVLRSRSIALEEMNMGLTANHDKMEAEVNSLHYQLETEKTRYRKMQTDLQKELNVVFEENTKLTSLLDGKVPKNLIDSVELERTVTSLNKELAASREAEGALRAQLEEMSSFQSLPDKVDDLTKQVSELTEELCAVQSVRDNLLSAQTKYQEEAEQREEELRQQSLAVTQQLEALQSEQERSGAERSQLMAAIEEKGLKLEESDQHRAALGEKLNEMQQLIKDLEEKLADSEVSRTTEEEISKELQEQLNQLNEELQSVRAEQTAAEQSSAVEELHSTVTSLTAERDQLKLNLQEHVDMAAETQVLVQSLQEELNELKLKDSDLLKVYEEKESDLAEKIQRLSQELQCARDENETLLMTSTQRSSEEVETLLSTVASLTAERDQLQLDMKDNVEMMIENQEELRSALEKNREQKKLIEELESAQSSRPDGHGDVSAAEMEQLTTQIQTLTEELERVKAERDCLLSENMTSTQTSTEELVQLQAQMESLSEERNELQEILEGVRQEKNQLVAELEEAVESQQTEVRSLTEKLQSIEAERSRVQPSVEVEMLQSRVTSVTEERDQLQEILEGLRQEKHQLKEQLEEQMEMVVQAQNGFNQHEVLNSELHMQDARENQLQDEIQQLQAALQTATEQKNQVENELQRSMETIQQLEENLEKTKEEVTRLKSDLQENVELMIENQELRVSQEKVKALHEEISMLRSQKADLESRASRNDPDKTLQLQELKDQIQSLTEELQGVQAERDSLLSEKTSITQTSTEELEKLQSRVTSVTEEREQLQEILEGLREEKKQLRAELEDQMGTLQAEMAQLNVSLQTVSEQKKLLEDELQQNMNMVSSTQERLKSVQDQLCEQKNRNAHLEKLSEEKESSLDQKIKDLTDKLERVEAERHVLLSEQEAHCQTSTEEMETLQSRVTSLTEERGQLQEILEGLMEEKQQLTAELEETMEALQTERRTLTEKLQMTEAERDRLMSEKQTNTLTSAEEKDELQSRVVSLSEERDQMQQILEGVRQEKNQLRAELEEKMEMTSTLQEKLKQMSGQHQSEREQESRLQQEVQKLEEQLHVQTSAAESLQQLLSESNVTITALKEQLSSSEQKVTAVKQTEASRLQDSTGQLQESFGKFQQFIETCSKYNSTALDNVLRVQCSLKSSHLSSLPKPSMDAYSTVYQLGWQTLQSLLKIQDQLHMRAVEYKKMFEELVKKDLSVFEERRMQDVLLCRAQAPSYSIKDEDFRTLWEHRVTELLEKRKFYLQKMAVILERLWANQALYLNELKAEIQERQKFKEQLQALITNQPINFSALDNILSQEKTRTSAVEQNLKLPLQAIMEEQNGLFEEMKQVEAQADSRLRDEKSKNSTLLRCLDGAPLKTELSLLKDNQQLVVQLQEAEERVKALCVQNEQLEEAQVKANNRVSNHKQATQLLQTELEDSRALVEEKENAIMTLKNKLRESEKKASPSAVELQEIQSKLFKMEMKLSSASDEHQKEIQTMTKLLNEKEDSLRKLKETLRKSQQEAEESILQGEDLHARLTNPRGLLIKSSIQLEKTKLEEEIKQLQTKISELESLVSSQQVEITKWKNRAMKLKGKTKPELNKPASPCTPSKRAFPMTSDSDFLSSPKKFLVTPRKVLDSPRKVLESPRKQLDSTKASLLDSPKSRFFDAGGSSELLSRSCPKQFFDNSSLGTLPDGAVGADKKDEWWPQSPKQEEMCKTQ